jgi:tetratricopeptide (TPR) repeat protein
MRAGVVEAAETALKLDPGSGGAYTALALLEPWANLAEREALLGEALAAGPNDPDGLIAMTEFCYTVGRHKDALRYSSRACDVDPLHLLAVWWRATVMALHFDEPDGGQRRLQAFRAQWPQEQALGYVGLVAWAWLGKWALFDADMASMRERGDIAPAMGNVLPSTRRCENAAPRRGAAYSTA